MQTFAGTCLLVAIFAGCVSGVSLKGNLREPEEAVQDTERYSIPGSTRDGFPRAAFTRSLPRVNGNYLSAMHSGYGPSDYMEQAKAEFQQPTINTVAGQEAGHPSPPSDPPEPPPFKPRPFEVYTTKESATAMKGHLEEGSKDFSGPPSVVDFKRIPMEDPAVDWMFPSFGPISGGQVILVGGSRLGADADDISSVTVADIDCENPAPATDADLDAMLSAATRHSFVQRPSDFGSSASSGIVDNLAKTNICCVRVAAEEETGPQCAVAPRSDECPKGFVKVLDEFSFPGEWRGVRASRPMCCLNAVRVLDSDSPVRGAEMVAAEQSARGRSSPAVPDIDFFGSFAVDPAAGAVPCVVDRCASAYVEVDAHGSEVTAAVDQAEAAAAATETAAVAANSAAKLSKLASQAGGLRANEAGAKAGAALRASANSRLGGLAGKGNAAAAGLGGLAGKGNTAAAGLGGLAGKGNAAAAGLGGLIGKGNAAAASAMDAVAGAVDSVDAALDGAAAAVEVPVVSAETAERRAVMREVLEGAADETAVEEEEEGEGETASGGDGEGSGSTQLSAGERAEQPVQEEERRRALRRKLARKMEQAKQAEDAETAPETEAVVVAADDNGHFLLPAVEEDAVPSWWKPYKAADKPPPLRAIKCTTGSGSPTNGAAGPVVVASKSFGITSPSRSSYMYLSQNELRAREAAETVSAAREERLASYFTD